MTEGRIKELRQLAQGQFVQWDCIVLECLAEIEILHRQIGELEETQREWIKERDFNT